MKDHYIFLNQLTKTVDVLFCSVEHGIYIAIPSFLGSIRVLLAEVSPIYERCAMCPQNDFPL